MVQSKGQCGFGRVGGVTIPPVVARIFSGDSTSPLTRDGHGCPKLNAQSFARMRNQQSVHMARVIVLFEDSAVLQWLWERKGSVQREGQARQGHCAERGVIVFLRWLWGWRGLVQREERAPPLRKARGIVRMQNKRNVH